MGKTSWIYILLGLLLFSACKKEAAVKKEVEPKAQKIENTAPPPASVPQGSFDKMLSSDSGYEFRLVYDENKSLSSVVGKYEGDEVLEKQFSGKLMKEFITDLNKDGDQELFLVVKGKTGTDLYGFGFNDDQATPITIVNSRKVQGVINSRYKLASGQLVHEYTMKEEDGTAKKGTSAFNLVDRDGTPTLLPQGWRPVELKGMSGQYASREGAKAKLYKVMQLVPLDGGRWRVEIRVKQKVDKKTLCEFTGIGEFIDHDLFVPLSEANPRYQGTLQIRFLDLMAIVYTEDVADNKEMTEICNGTLSISGNFKKTDI